MPGGVDRSAARPYHGLGLHRQLLIVEPMTHRSVSRCLAVLLALGVGVGAASCGSDTTGPIPQHPTLTVQLRPDLPNVLAGDTIAIKLTATDSTALIYTVIRLSGAFVLTDSMNAGRTRSVTRTAHIAIPQNDLYQTTLHISVETMNGGGAKVADTLPDLQLFDRGAIPAITGSYTTTHASAGALAGDTLALSEAVTDRHALKYIGYRVGAPANVADSEFTTASSHSLSRRLVIPAAWVGQATITLFARDSIGNFSSVDLGELTVGTRSRRPILSLDNPGSIYDIAFDTKRNVAYLSMPDAQQVAVLSLTTATLGTPYAFAATFPRGVDLTLSGDTLAVALGNTANIALVNLSSSAVSMIDVRALATSGEPDHLRITNANKIVTSLSGGGTPLRETDLSTGGTRVIAQATDQLPLGESGNRTRIFVQDDGGCCPTSAFIYDAPSGSIIAFANSISNFSSSVSADFAGDKFLVDTTVYDVTIPPPLAVDSNALGGGPPRPSQIAPDGKSGYFETPTGFARKRLSDRATLETFTLGEQPFGMWLSRDGLTMIATAPLHTYVIDLW